MLVDQVAPMLVADHSILGKQLLDHWSSEGLAFDSCEKLFSATPLLLRVLPCFLDRVTHLWRYEFGPPFITPEGHFLFGPHVWQDVKLLARVICIATSVMPPEDLKSYFHRLVVEDKHSDTLTEFQPLLNLVSRGFSGQVVYEAQTGLGTKSADWCLEFATGPKVFLEVKNRSIDIIQLSDLVAAGQRRPNGHAPPPEHDVSMLFRSVESKYSTKEPDEQLQGAWISSPLGQDETKLIQAFRELNHDRVHFAILGNWSNAVQVLAASASLADFLVGQFGGKSLTTT